MKIKVPLNTCFKIIEHHRQILEACMWDSNYLKPQISHCKNSDICKDAIGQTLFEVYLNESVELCRLKRSFSWVSIGNEMCLHGNWRECPFLNEDSIITYIGALARLCELRSIKVHQGPMSSLTKRKNIKIVRNIKKLKHYTNIFQVKF